MQAEREGIRCLAAHVKAARVGLCSALVSTDDLDMPRPGFGGLEVWKLMNDAVMSCFCPRLGLGEEEGNTLSSRLDIGSLRSIR